VNRSEYTICHSKETKLLEKIDRLTDLMGFKLFKRNSQRSTSTRRRSLNLSFRRPSRSSREEIRSIQNGDAFYFSDRGPKTSKEVGTALRAIGDELYRSALSLHSAS